MWEVSTPADQSELSAQQGSDGQDASSAGGGSIVIGGSADWPEQGGLGMHISVSDAGSVTHDSADESELGESDADMPLRGLQNCQTDSKRHSRPS